MVAWRKAWSPPCSCWPHYSWHKPGCHWPAWPPGHTVGSCSAGCRPTPQGPFPLDCFPATPPQACSVAWGCCDRHAESGIWPCWTSYGWPQHINPACPDPSAEPSYPQADQHSHPAWCHLHTYWVPSSTPLLKMLNKTRPKAEPWGTALVTGHQLDWTPITTPLCARPFSQFFTLEGWSF